jgi:hypothetical protein
VPELYEWLPHAVFFILGVLVTLVFAWFQRKRKTLDWELLADEPIVSAGSEYLGSTLTLEWEGSKLEHPRLISLRIFNSGNREVKRDVVPVHMQRQAVELTDVYQHRLMPSKVLVEGPRLLTETVIGGENR